MIYECLRCGFVAKQKGHFMDHLNRKNICPPTLEPISINEIKTYYNLHNNSESLQSAPNLLQNAPELLQNAPNDSISAPAQSGQGAPFCSIFENSVLQNAPNCSKMLHFQDNKPTCEYCLRTYSKNSNLTKHLKVCKKKKQQELLQNTELAQIKKELEELKSYNKIQTQNNNSHNTTNNTNNTTNNNNNNTDNSTNFNNNIQININNYGDENKDYISRDYLIELLKKPFQAIPELIKFIHFNDEHPENQNIKLPNKKQPYVKIRKNNKWELADRKETINDLIDQKHSELNNTDFSLINDETFKKNELNRIERFNEKYMSDDKEFVNQLYKDTELVIINNSK